MRREFKKQARKHGETCELCRPDEHGRRPDAVVRIVGVRCCERHVLLVLAIANASPAAVNCAACKEGG